MLDRKKIILISKDAMGRFYLPVYGNTYWKTPNIDELAKKGTVFYRHYTAAPSSAMSYTSMFWSIDSFNTKRKDWRPVKGENYGDTLFDKAEALGYKCYIIWDKKWMTTAKIYSECYGKNTVFHPIEDFQQCVGAHFPHKGELSPSDEKAQIALEKLYRQLEEIVKTEERVFVWLHFPHVINGRTCYGADIDLFDKAIGKIREWFKDDSIYITADHGNMNGEKGKICYGFDVYEPAVSIPLITPRIGNESKVTIPTSNVDLYGIIFKQVIVEKEFVYSDTAYYAQPNRRLAIIYGKWKYIYSQPSIGLSIIRRIAIHKFFFNNYLFKNYAI